MSHIHPRRRSHPWPALASALGATAAIALAAAACAAPAPAEPPPEPTATLLSAPWTVAPESQATPPPIVAPLTAGDVQATADIEAFATSLSATVAALASPAATSEPAVAVNTVVPIAGCAVPKTPPGVRVQLGAVDAEAPESVKAWWSADAAVTRSFEGDVVAMDHSMGEARIRASRGDDAFDVVLFTVDVPLSPGQHIQVRWHDERGQPVPGGYGESYGLSIADDHGLVALVVALGFSLADDSRILAGERGGMSIRQLRSPCTVGESSGCGYSLHAAPATFSVGTDVLTLSPGETGVLASSGDGLAYDVRLATSHVILTEDNMHCSDWTPWVLSYTVIRK